MKSVIQESSTLGKAIDLAWSKAGSPTEFTVKILQQPKRGFLGLNSQAAKVVMFFDEKHIPGKQASDDKRNQTHQRQRQALRKDSPQGQRRHPGNKPRYNKSTQPKQQDGEKKPEQGSNQQGPKRRPSKWKKENPRYRQDRQHKRSVPAHGDSEKQRSVDKD